MNQHRPVRLSEARRLLDALVTRELHHSLAGHAQLRHRAQRTGGYRPGRSATTSRLQRGTHRSLEVPVAHLLGRGSGSHGAPANTRALRPRSRPVTRHAEKKRLRPVTISPRLLPKRSLTDSETGSPARQTRTEPILSSNRSAASEIRALTPSPIIDGPDAEGGTRCIRHASSAFSRTKEGGKSAAKLRTECLRSPVRRAAHAARRSAREDRL